MRVKVDGIPVQYRPTRHFKDPNNMDSDKPRQTVDAGFWDGSIGEFVEIKFSPESYQTKDINYLRLLSNKLASSNINFLIFLVAMGDKDLIKYRLIRLDVNPGSNEFCLVGQDELFDMQSA